MENSEDDYQDSVAIRVDDYLAIAFVDSGATSDFVSVKFVDMLGRRVGPRPRDSKDYRGATGERLVITGTVEMPITWSVEGRIKS